MAVDSVFGWLEAISGGGIIPPFSVELVLRNGTHHSLHSVISFDRETRTMCARIWDLRAFEPKEIEELKQGLNKIHDRQNLADAEGLHPKLDWANLRLHFDDVAYCIEWHDRLWPADSTPKIGFKT